MLTLNMQPVEKQDLREDGSLDVHSIFYTIQGEGPDAGTPAVFVRLAGCNLTCPICDTDYTSKRDRKSVECIIEEIKSFSSCCDLVVLTGGEPFRQNIVPLVSVLINSHYSVQIETNGTFYSPAIVPLINSDQGWLSIVCSPKSPTIHSMLAKVADAYKYVLDADHVHPADGLPSVSMMGAESPPARPPQNWYGDIFVQPMDTQDPIQNKRNQDAAIASCMKYGYRLSLQTHKILGME